MRYKTFEKYLKRNYQGPYMATDIIIRYDDGSKKGIVLIERKNFPFGLSLPGGMAEKMPLRKNAIKEAREETGLDVILDNPDRPLCVCDDPNQDPRAFIASAVYTALGRGTLKPHPDEDAISARVYLLNEVVNLLKKPSVWAFPKHHRKSLRIYLEEVEKNPDWR